VLKVLSPRLSASPDFLTRFEQETAPLLALGHPSIAGPFERGRSGNLFFLATEHLPGGSLRERIREPLSKQAAFHLVLDVARALEHAHARGLVHLGLKPENVFRDASGAAKVTDFGMARLRGGNVALRPAYAAPEQWIRPAAADGRADLYALATLLYELLYGQLPPQPWARGKVQGLHGRIDARLDALFARSLAEDPDKRFRRIGDFSAELAQILPAGAEATEDASAPQASRLLSIEVRGQAVYVTFRGQGNAEELKRSLPDLERALSTPGPWGLAYDLTATGGWSTKEVALLIDLHRRHRVNLRRIGFCAPIAAVRGGGVLVGTSVKEIPWNIFASPKIMKEWVEREMAR
jgi:serine/threonine protein kinase